MADEEDGMVMMWEAKGRGMSRLADTLAVEGEAKGCATGLEELGGWVGVKGIVGVSEGAAPRQSHLQMSAKNKNKFMYRQFHRLLTTVQAGRQCVWATVQAGPVTAREAHLSQGCPGPASSEASEPAGTALCCSRPAMSRSREQSRGGEPTTSCCVLEKVVVQVHHHKQLCQYHLEEEVARPRPPRWNWSCCATFSC